MKLKHLSQFAHTRFATCIFFTELMVLLLVGLSAEAQGVLHLGPGSSYLFSQPSFVRGQIDEGGGNYFLVQLGFTGDLFTLGDSLQVDVLASPTSLTPLATGTTSNPPWIIADQINFSWIGSPWDTVHGAVRLTMLTGSVDVASVLGISASQFIQRTYSFPVPEPSVSLLLAPGLLYLFLRQRHSSPSKPA